jgi:FemAB-related protein (PEP-CTERM system-associated)
MNRIDSLTENKSITFKLCDSSREKEWQSYIVRHPLSVFAHRIEWKKVVEATYGHRPFYIMAYQNGRVVGVLPLFLIKSIIFGKYMITSPYLTHGGLICDYENVGQTLLAHARDVARNHGVDYMEIRNDEAINGFDDTKSVYCTMKTDLTKGLEHVWKMLPSRKTRQSVNKAHRFGLKIVSSHEYIDQFIRLHVLTMRRLGTPDHNPSFFHHIFKFVPSAELLMIRYQEQFIAAMILVRHKDGMDMHWNACLKEYYKVQPNNFMFWEAIKHAYSSGCTSIDFGRSKWDSGTFKFKKYFGAQPFQIYYQYLLNRCSETPDVDPTNKKYQKYISTWQKMPLWLVKLIGPSIIRNIA